MLPRDRVEKILALHEAGWSARDIADQLGHARQTVRDYVDGRRTPGIRAPRPSLLAEPLARYCRQRLIEDPHLRPITLFTEAAELGFPGSRSTFYRELALRRLLPESRRQAAVENAPAQGAAGTYRSTDHTPVLPRRIAPIAGETLASFLNRLALANRLTLAEVLASLPTWFTTKTKNPDDRAQHHLLTPTTTQALHALARLADTRPAALAHALPAFGASEGRSPLRSTTACQRCAARRGILQPEAVPVNLPMHHKICTHHGLWLSDLEQPHIDLRECPEITAAQHRASRLLRRYTAQQLALAQQAAITAIPIWPASPTDISSHWRLRLLILQTSNHRRGISTDHDAYNHAAIYPDVIDLATAILTSEGFRRIKQDPMAESLHQPAENDREPQPVRQ